MHKILIYFVLIGLLSCSCKRTSSTYSNQANEPNANLEFEKFEDFHNRFYSDSVFQIKRTIFPLPGYNSDNEMGIPNDVAEKLGIQKKEYFWEKEKWLSLKNLQNSDEYKISISKTDTLITEEIIIPESGYRTSKKFKLIEKKWFLVYYFYQNI